MKPLNGRSEGGHPRAYSRVSKGDSTGCVPASNTVLPKHCLADSDFKSKAIKMGEVDTNGDNCYFYKTRQQVAVLTWQIGVICDLDAELLPC